MRNTFFGECNSKVFGIFLSGAYSGGNASIGENQPWETGDRSNGSDMRVIENGTVCAPPSTALSIMLLVLPVPDEVNDAVAPHEKLLKIISVLLMERTNLVHSGQ